MKHVDRSAAVHTHTELGATMIYFSVVLLLVALAVMILHRRERTRPSSGVLTFIVASLVIVVAVATSMQSEPLPETDIQSHGASPVSRSEMVERHCEKSVAEADTGCSTADHLDDAADQE